MYFIGPLLFCDSAGVFNTEKMKGETIRYRLMPACFDLVFEVIG